MHPNLFLSKEDVEKYKLRIAEDQSAMSRYQTAVSETEKFLEEEFISEEKANGGTSQHADFGLLNHQANRFCSVLGVKYLIEGDERCAEKIKQFLLHYIKFERWYSSSYTRRTPVPWHSDLCSTANTLAFSSLYDIIYDYLTQEERKEISRGILDKGVIPAFSDWVIPETRIHALDSMGHNWWSVCISESAIALLALQDELPDECRKLLPLADKSLADYMKYKGNALFNKLRNFDEQGLFYESTAYNNFGTGTLLRYLWCNERYFGKNELIRSAIPEGLCDALMTFSYPVMCDGKIRYDFLNFGDSSVKDDYSLFTKYAIRLGIATESLKACAATYRTDIMEEIGGFCLDNIGGSFENMPANKLFSSGYAVSHSSYEPDSTVFAVKSGFCWNHSHNDSGTFVIFHKGKPLFTDGGKCNYDSPLYHTYYCQDISHSVLRIGNEGRRDEELYRGTKFPGKISGYYEGRGFLFVQADSAGPMAHLCSRMFRNFFWIENRILVIFDEVYCHKDKTVQFTLHFDADFTHNGNETVFDNHVSKARFISHLPDMAYSVKQGHPDFRETEEMPYIELSTEEEKREHLLIHTIELDFADNPACFTKLDGKSCEGIRIETDDYIRDIWFNHMADGHIMHDNSNNIISGFDTDAYLLMISENKKTGDKQAFAVNASYLRSEKEVFLSSFVKNTAEVLL